MPNENTYTDAVVESNKDVKMIKSNGPVQQSDLVVEPILMKKVIYNNVIPKIVWTEDKVDRMNTCPNLQYAVVGKFSYGWLELEELHTQIPK